MGRRHHPRRTIRASDRAKYAIGTAKNTQSAVHRVAPADRSVFRDLFSVEEATELEMRSVLLFGLERWLSTTRITPAKAAKVLGVTRPDIGELRRGKVSRFPLGLLVHLAARAGLK
jgi:predicted XRE-type DNA-binding protein